MNICVTNAQRHVAVDIPRILRLARCAIRRLDVQEQGTMAITFVSDQRMRSLNRRFLRHDWPTDVLSFRYDRAQGSGLRVRGKSRNVLGPQPPALNPKPVVGEILIAPSQARAYARAHGISYEHELARYVVHGLLHWMGHEDQTPAQQKRMRVLEDQVLAGCYR